MELERLRDRLAKLQGGLSPDVFRNLGLSDVQYPTNQAECQQLIAKLING